MPTETIAIPSGIPGTEYSLTVHRFGRREARPHVYIQAALHADEIPGMICAQVLRRELAALDAAGALQGQVTLVPVANPIGLAQQVLGQPVGRFSLSDGSNFNRDFPDLAALLVARVGDRLTKDEALNGRLVREVFAETLWQQARSSAPQHLKATLLQLALEADLVLDLHCDADAALHLYTQPRSLVAFTPLAALLGAKAILLADVSGGDPFDEALSRPWAELAKARPDRPLPAGCHAVTVELRGQADVCQDLAEADARAILGFLRHAEVLDGEKPDLPPLLCRPTRLEASEPIIAPAGGILTYRRQAGETVQAGEVLADIIDPITGALTPVATLSAGMFYARSAETFVTPGKRLGKVAGDSLRRSGRLLSP
ncbi:MAG: M14 family metallopeptidase [Beijerinckiaceae bacterium]|nr:M14 family metallopeptidase [Beijerinckiaceae bacterium]MCZ8299497.1 M14 family metallopeptidase [Beijerinckiaceae bacterium]